METIDERYLVQQNKLGEDGKKPPVFAKVMRSKEGEFCDQDHLRRPIVGARLPTFSEARREDSN